MSEPKTIRVLGSGGDYEDHPNPNYKEPSSFAAPAGYAADEELRFLRLEAENMALSLEAAGFGRPAGRMCTPLERYRGRYPRRHIE